MIKIFEKLIFKKNDDKLKKISVKEVIRSFKNKENLNLFFLVKKRFEWMQKYISKGDIGLEVGAGAGFSKSILKSNKIFTSDFSNDDHLDFKGIDAQATNFKNEEFNFVIASNMLHHLPSQFYFLKEMNRILKKMEN